MRLRSIAATLLFAALSVCAWPRTAAQERPLTRTFIGGTEERYQVTASIRVETHGVSTEKVGEKAYADFYTHQADGQVSWRASRQISSVRPDGSASIKETLDSFHADCNKDFGAKSFNAALQKSVEDTCASWQSMAPMNYEEEKFGLIRGLPSAAGMREEGDTSLLSLWLRRAFRPSVILPAIPIQFGTRAEHKIGNSSGEDNKPRGEEVIEWLEAPGETPAATLHVSQSLSWIDPPAKGGFNDVTGKPSMRQLFYADSLNSISLLDGTIVKASRSATREMKELLEPVPGLLERPLFSSKLTITVTILRLP